MSDDTTSPSSSLPRLNLVTGAFGFSGSFVIRELLASGQRVIGTDLPATLASQKRRDTLAAIGLRLDHPDLELVPADLLEPATLAPLFARPLTHVFHTASLYDYGTSLTRLLRINVGGIDNLLAAMVAAQRVGAPDRGALPRLIHWSTCGVFGKPRPAAERARANLPFREDSPSPKTMPFEATAPAGTHLVNAYSVSKWEQEKRVWRAHREQRLPVTVIRPAPIYGPGSDYGHGGIIIAIARGYLPAIPAAARNAITTSVHVEDLARFVCFVAERDDAVGEDYNVVDNSIVSYHEFLHYIALLCGRPMVDIPLLPLSAVRLAGLAAAHTWTWLERRLGVPRVRVLEIQSATYIGSSYWISNRKSLATGFTYRYPDVRDGLRDTVDWLRQAGWIG